MSGRQEQMINQIRVTVPVKLALHYSKGVARVRSLSQQPTGVLFVEDEHIHARTSEIGNA